MSLCRRGADIRIYILQGSPLPLLLYIDLLSTRIAGGKDFRRRQRRRIFKEERRSRPFIAHSTEISRFHIGLLRVRKTAKGEKIAQEKKEA
jgi:hypothetical protein